MNPQDYRLLIFDWDGTLADSTAQIVSGVQTAFAEHGLPPPPEADVRHIIGLSLSEALQRLHPGLSAAQTRTLTEAYKTHYFTRRPPTVLFEQARAALPLLQQHYWLAVATGKGRRGLDLAMQETGSARFFLATRTVDECAAKPQPEMVLSLCEEFGVAPAQALVIGDTTHDLNMARNARCHAVSVTTGAHTAEQLQTVPHRAMLGGIGDLLRWLNLPDA